MIKPHDPIASPASRTAPNPRSPPEHYTSLPSLCRGLKLDPRVHMQMVEIRPSLFLSPSLSKVEQNLLYLVSNWYPRQRTNGLIGLIARISPQDPGEATRRLGCSGFQPERKRARTRTRKTCSGQSGTRYGRETLLIHPTRPQAAVARLMHVTAKTRNRPSSIFGRCPHLDDDKDDSNRLSRFMAPRCAHRSLLP